MKALEDNIAIIVIAYNRPVSLKRVLSSLNNAIYNEDENIKLIISIDKGDSIENSEVVRIAENFHWRYGEKIVIQHKENLGLRNHVLKSGDLTEIYENVVILEDDLYVSRYFYDYLKKSLEYYKNQSEIAGISLYSHQFNESASLPFMPIKDDYDVFFMQIPSSWGQLFTRKQWKEFRNWYELNKTKPLLVSEGVPKNVVDWPDSSWKKYFQKYMIETKKYFVYPYVSHSTNFGDVGKHFWKDSKTFQVPLSREKRVNYRFCNINETISVYDAYCENENIFKFLNLIKLDLEVDLYGIKAPYTKKKYLLTTQVLNFKKVDSFGLSLRPMEENVIRNIKGNEIFLYDTTKKEKNSNKFLKEKSNLNKFEYFYPGLNIEKSFTYTFNPCNLLQIIKYLRKKLLK